MAVYTTNWIGGMRLIYIIQICPSGKIIFFEKVNVTNTEPICRRPTDGCGMLTKKQYPSRTKSRPYQCFALKRLKKVTFSTSVYKCLPKFFQTTKVTSWVHGEF